MNSETFQPIRLMLVEDDSESGAAMLAMLVKRNIQVTLFENADDAITAFNPGKFDIVVTDIRLGRLSGIDLLRHIRKDLPDFPVILLTGFEDIDSAIESVRLGASDYILKPLEEIDKLLGPMAKAVKVHRTEQELQRYRAKLRALTLDLTLAEEKERHRMAVDLHDSISQSIGSLKIRMDVLLEDARSQEVRNELSAMSTSISGILKDIRTLTFQLCPATLYELGLNQALGDLVKMLRSTYKMDIVLATNRASRPLNKNLEILLFRSARELLMNVVKHAKAKQTSVTISEQAGQIELLIEDNGIGFNVTENINSGIGLFSVAERIRYAGGQCTITSSPGNGTTAKLTIPADAFT